MRVAVEFGKSKLYTAVVARIHQEPPTAYEAKGIDHILDTKAVVTEKQLEHWQWMAHYYMCSLGEVMRSALPSALLPQSETQVLRNPEFTDSVALTDDEFMILEALENQPSFPIQKIRDILERKRILPLVNELLAKKVIVLKEELVEVYKPKLVDYIRLADDYTNDDQLNDLLNSLGRAKQQHELLLTFFSLKARTQKPVSVKQLKKASGVSDAVMKAVIEKGIFEKYHIQTDRIVFDEASDRIKELTPHQQETYMAVREHFEKKDVVLLHGITSSGKTEIYVKLIGEVLEQGKQVLYLVPEIALTTQLIQRLQRYFGNRIAVFHSRYSFNERVEVWNNTLADKPSAQLILGARSAVFLPFNDLGLIIVDEEHEPSYKQFDPAPRYHARDAAIVLANLHHAKVLLGSATPAIESFYNAKQDKYGLVTLNRRYQDLLLPEIELADLKESYRKKRMTGHFTERLFLLMQEALAEKEQVILFQNRRGYAPVVTCKACGVAPQCVNCDVSLTYHKSGNELRCHYCGYHIPLMETCNACGSPALDTKGLGTEQVEAELTAFFPEAKVARMDLDTTRGKYGYQRILDSFKAREIDILVGTQMLSKGLDFDNVSLVGVMNADNMLNFPDFRAHERSFQLLTQVAGRAGRSGKRGRVIIQTYNPFHKILQQVTTNDYMEMYKEQLDERYAHNYPPISRLVRITLKHKDFLKVSTSADWLYRSLYNSFGSMVLGPSSPAVSRIRNQHIKTLLIKLPKDKPLKHSKLIIQKIRNSFQSIPDFRAVRFNVDVDCY